MNIKENQRFSRLTTIKIYGKTKNRGILWECVCDCGNIKIAYSGHLRSGDIQSCGCLQIESIKRIATKHGMEKTKFYGIWASMKYRCNNNKSVSYKNYGGRGITHDPRWDDFINFKKDMYQAYVFAKKKYRKELKIKNNYISIERKDVNGNYYKENCCWIPMNEQYKNKRTKRAKK